MKKIALFVIFIAIALSYSCKKEVGKVSTTISGTLLTNGTNSPIKVNKELKRPIVSICHVVDQLGYTTDSYEEIASVEANLDGSFSITLDLIKGDDYFWGVTNLDTTYYLSGSLYHYWTGFYNYYYNRVSPGQSNSIKPYCLAKSWIRPRFINSNPDPNNQDVFDLVGGDTGPLSTDILLDDIYSINKFFPLHGKIDTLAPWIHKTWSGTYKYGIKRTSMVHKVYGKLTRNGQTKDMEIIYNAPPFDTTVVEIRY